MNDITSADPTRDRRLLYATAFIRSLAIGMLGVSIGLYLTSIPLESRELDFVVAAGLIGGAGAALLATFRGDHWGRRRFLSTAAVLGAIGALGAAAAATPGWIGLAAFIGMLNGMGRERGAFLVLEQAILPGTAGDAERTKTFARYNVLQDTGLALGSLLAGLPALAYRLLDMKEIVGHRFLFVLYALLMLATAVLYLRLSAISEAQAPDERFQVSPETRRILFRISSLFLLDSLGGGFLATALITAFFKLKFPAQSDWIAPLYFLARIVNALSHLGAAWLAKRIGLVNTMVFTHIPSSLLLATVPFAPSFWVAAFLFLLREGLVEMDVPTRQSYVMALVRPEERTLASGVTNLVRLGGWAAAPAFAGLFTKFLTGAFPLFVGAGLKIVYDVALYVQFRKIRPPEETPPAA